MKFVTVRDFRAKPAAIWKELKKEKELIITNNGKPIALLTPISEDRMEKNLKAMRKAMASESLSSMRKSASARGADSMTFDDIDKEIKKHRSGR